MCAIRPSRGGKHYLSFFFDFVGTLVTAWRLLTSDLFRCCAQKLRAFIATLEEDEDEALRLLKADTSLANLKDMVRKYPPMTRPAPCIPTLEANARAPCAAL